MPYLLKAKALIKGFGGIRLAFLASVMITWPVLAELELFERFYDYSRAHEELDLDEVALLIANLAVALIISNWLQSRKLSRLAKAREFEHQRAEMIARHDPLTGLMNRRAFTEMLDESCPKLTQGCSRFIAMIDLDKFKPINDLHGHAAGDATLVGVAKRLRDELSTIGTVARLGGDEFVVVFDCSVNALQAERVARRIISALGQPFEYEQAQLFLGCSIGLVNWDYGTPGSEALGRADRALYSAKMQGRNRVKWYDAELDLKSIERSRIEADLRLAIERGDIEPWFQPIVSINTQSVTGFEVLARWNHADYGAISPEIFIEIAESSGQIGPLSMSLLRKACLSACHWRDDLAISFNISAYQFHDKTLVEDIKRILDETNFAPNRLTIEITESAVISDFNIALAKVNSFKELGISVALDDFGTGFSSLATLRKLPFDRLKIDRSFVTNISSEFQNQKIVTGIMSLAHGLELDVTAEGIETEEDLDFLQNLNCSMGQGFLFEKAIPAEKVSRLLETEWGELRRQLLDAGGVPLGTASKSAVRAH